MYSENKTLWKRLGFTLIVLALFQIAVSTPLPNLSAKVADSPLLDLLNITSGGGFSTLSLFALGLTPYVTATIITQLLSNGVSKTMTLWSEQGTAGRNKINNVTKIVMVVLALMQAPALVFAFKQLGAIGVTSAPTLKTYVFATLITTAGAVMAKFMGDELNRHGLGNGASLLIAANIAAQLPDTINIFIGLFKGKDTQATGWLSVIVFVGGIVAITFMELTERRLKLQSTRQHARSNDAAYLPIKLNPSGMIPVIFAGGIVAIAQSLTTFAAGNTAFESVAKFLSLESTSGKIVYGIVVFVFGVFYAFTQLNPTKLSKQLANNGTYIMGVAYNETENFLALNIVQLSVIGSAILTVLALLPFILGIGKAVSLISMLILIVTVIELTRQIKGLLHKNHYETTL